MKNLEIMSGDDSTLTLAADKAWRRTSRDTRAKQHSNNRNIYPEAVTVKGEPRIQYLKRVLEALLRCGSFSVAGDRVEVDGFRLRNVEDWVDREPPSPEEIFELLSARCAVKCEFCYLRMDPEQSVTQFNTNDRSSILDDINYRLGLAESGQKLFAPTFQLEEILGNPHFRSVARRIREYSDDVFCLNTTGSALNAEMLDFLDSVQPVELRISLNAVDPMRRYQLMRDRRNVVLAALEGIKARNMRFSVSLVMWPNIPWTELRDAILFADQYQPYGVFAILPGYTDVFFEGDLFESEEYWRDATERLVALRYEIGTPLIIHPRLFEEVSLGYRPNEPVVIGVTPRSAADLGGVCIGDVILAFEGFNPLWSRRQLANLMAIRHFQSPEHVRVVVRRGNSTHDLSLPVEEARREGYAHIPPFVDYFGINLLSQGVALSDVREIGRLAERHSASVVGICTSSLVLPGLEDILETWGQILTPGIEIVPFVAPNRFYGGNICLGELCTVTDFQEGIRMVCQQRADIDLVIIPSPAFGPGGWWRDLAGVPFTHLQRSFDFPIELLICSPFE